jgi:hypothetical protein
MHTLLAFFDPPLIPKYMHQAANATASPSLRPLTARLKANNI